MSTARAVFPLSKELHKKKSRGEVRLGMGKSPIASPAVRGSHMGIFCNGERPKEIGEFSSRSIKGGG